jgi:hypothetical protein
MATIDEIRAAQNTPTDFSAFDASAAEDAAAVNAHRFAGDDKLLVQFYKRPILNPALSVKEGRPIYKEEVCIRIRIPGDKLNQIDRVADSIDIERFRRHYEKFIAGQSQLVGTPLEEVGFVPAPLVEELKHFNIYTVEQLAGVSDGVAQKIAGLQSFKQKAQAYLDALGDPEKVLQRAKEQVMAEVGQELRKRDHEVAELRALISKLTKGKKVEE